LTGVHQHCTLANVELTQLEAVPNVVHAVGRVDWSFASQPLPASATSSGLARQVLVGPQEGAVHTELAVGALTPGGWLQRHFHSFEEALYVLEGDLLLEHDGRVHGLVQGDYALMPIGLWHALANGGNEPVRWLSVNTPQRLPPDAGRRDTFFASEPFDLDAFAARAERPPFGNPTVRLVGHYDGTPPQAEALRVEDPARGRKPAGMDTALLAYSGISVKMLVDRVFGADLLTMFTVDYELGGAAQAHDHPFEETYFFLAGEVEGELDGEIRTLRPGDVVFSGVGSVHGFYNTGTERVRWIETQAPQPPARHAYRWRDAWKKLEDEGA
jgi:quercetin dioxygenase-like cupin family protein